MNTEKDLKKWFNKYPLLEEIVKTQEVFWFNNNYNEIDKCSNFNLTKKDIIEAEKRLIRFSDFLKEAFEETIKFKGIIESEVNQIKNLKPDLEQIFKINIKGNLYIKRDDSLPISGSIKARGGIYEVLKYAEDVALKEGLIKKDEDYSQFNNKEFKDLFSKYSLAVGSTGNLGLSIGIIGSKLGFKTSVHMAKEAKRWKKELLRKKGVNVIEYAADYSEAVKKGRKKSKDSPKSYFIDDERSIDLFLGYAVAALRLKKQLENKKIKVDFKNPLFVYLPCGVGGGPGGICFGLKKIFGPNVHCFFAEPTHSPSMLLGLLTGEHDQVSVYDFGIDNQTEADGLAVGRPSKFVGKLMKNKLSGIYTVSDSVLIKLLKLIYNKNSIKLEPSALAGVYGPVRLMKDKEKNKFYKKIKLDIPTKINHLIWATGGSMIPDKVFKEYLKNK
ncbi:MAG: D-serine ammonia-lyase [Halanaerobiales bacterium]|nr:D-serine ammonia-lyase [Halanaerobiales bacterium]